MRRTFAAVAAAAFVVAGCAGGHDGDDRSPAPDPVASESDTASESPSAVASPPATGSTAGVDVSSTPVPITQEWAEAVVNELNGRYGDVLAETLAVPIVGDTGQLPPAFEPRIRALFDGDYEEERIAEWSDIATDEDDIRDVLLPADEFIGLRFEATLLQYAGDDCVVVLGTIDGSGSARDRSFGDLLFAWSLTPASGADAANPTEWVILDQLANTSPEGEQNEASVMVEADLEEYGTGLVNTCTEEDRQ